MVLDSCGHETLGWSQLHANDRDLTTNYQMFGLGNPVANFHLQDGFLCHLGQLFVPSSEPAKMILESHYSWEAGHFGMDKTMVVLQKYFYWPKL